MLPELKSKLVDYKQIFYVVHYALVNVSYERVVCVLAAQGTPQHAEEQFLSKVFLYVALAFVFWLMIA